MSNLESKPSDEDKHKMRNDALWLILSCIFVVTLLLASCVPIAEENGEGEINQNTDIVSGLTVQDEAAIYARVITQLANVDNKLRGDHNLEILYVVNKKINFNSESPTWRIISEILQRDISSILSDLSIEHVWIDYEDWSNYSQKSSSAIITLCEISPQADESFKVWGGVFPENGGGGYILYVLVKVDGDWDIISTAGAGSG